MKRGGGGNQRGGGRKGSPSGSPQRGAASPGKTAGDANNKAATSSDVNAGAEDAKRMCDSINSFYSELFSRVCPCQDVPFLVQPLSQWDSLFSLELIWDLFFFF